MNKFFFLFKNSAGFLFLMFAFVTASLAQSPQYYNYNNGTAINTFPFGQPGGKQVQWLVLANDLNQPTPVPSNNYITKLYFFMGSTAATTFTDLTIKFGQTTITSLPVGVIYTGPLDMVYFRSSVTLSSVNSAWMSITLDAPFPYDPSQSLVIDVSQCGASTPNMYVRQTVLTPVRRNFMNHSGSCTFNFSGQDGAIINCGVDLVLLPLCEGFNSTTFPPSAWSKTGPGALYWTRRIISGFGLGVGSTCYDMYNALNGTIGSLITTSFLPSAGNDFITFDLAYCPWTSFPDDSLFILTSTNAGTTYTPLVKLGETQLGTASATCTHPFTPTAGDWGRRSYALPVGTNKIAFEGHSGFGDQLFLDSICVMNLVGINNKQTGIPKVFSLSQNYPNPFNPTTKIEFALPKSEFVNLIVYDILGAQVATLVNENMQAGIHTVNFKGDNLASGVYFYKIKAGDFTNIKKMVLLK